MDKLKPCPYCGCKAKLYEAYDGAWCAECMVCYARTFHGQTKEEAIQQWNRRANNE